MKIKKKLFLIVFILVNYLSCTQKCSEDTLSDNHSNEINNNVLNSTSNFNNNNKSEPVVLEKPVKPKIKSWNCPEGWFKVHHEEIKDVNDEQFFWCKPYAPRLQVDDYVTPVDEEYPENNNICNPETDGTFPVTNIITAWITLLTKHLA